MNPGLNKKLHQVLDTMQIIQLNKWNSSHGMFGIIENKCLIAKKHIAPLLEEINKTYCVLTIGNRYIFDYRDVYMDTIDFDFFAMHANKKNQMKLRTRFSSSNEGITFQVLNKANKRKSIYHFSPNDIDSPMSNESFIFFNGIYASITGKQPTFLPIPTLEVSFKRVILYNKKNNTRMNIDYDIRFTNQRSHIKESELLDNVVIVETKSMSDDDSLSSIIDKYKATSAKNLSKFYLGVQFALDKELSKSFDKTINKIDKIRF